MKPPAALAVGASVLLVLAFAAFWLERKMPTRAQPLGASTATLDQAQPSANTLQSSAIYALQLPDDRGVPTKLGVHSGKILVLNFWATWCTPCREEVPIFVKLQRDWGAQGVQFVGISVDHADKVQQFSRDHGVNYPLLLARDTGIDLSKSMGNRLGVMPHTLVLAPDGRTLLNRVGPVTQTQLTAIFSANVAEKATK